MAKGNGKAKEFIEGALAGAAAGAAAVFLSEKKNRDKVVKGVKKLEESAKKEVAIIKKKVADARKK